MKSPKIIIFIALLFVLGAVTLNHYKDQIFSGNMTEVTNNQNNDTSIALPPVISPVNSYTKPPPASF